MEYEKLCIHHTLRRICETCDLADHLEEAHAQIRQLKTENEYLKEDIRRFRQQRETIK